MSVIYLITPTYRQKLYSSLFASPVYPGISAVYPTLRPYPRGLSLLPQMTV